MKINFTKYQGAGNDFVIIDARDLEIKFDINLVQFLCDRRFGVGADGLLLLKRSGQEHVDFKMTYYNADGNESTMCGNGGRCIVAFAKRLGLIKESCVFEAIDGLHEAFFEAELVQLKMTDVRGIIQDKDFTYLDTGSPHHIEYVDAVETVDVKERGAEIRYADTYKSQQGTNVNFVQLKNQQLFIRTYERGVEAETLACGTGVTAAAIAGFYKYESLPRPIQVRAMGGELSVNFTVVDANHVKDIWLKGPAEFVFEGDIQC
ncbi:MAG: diaminopimelate epimerase [Psychroflexus sp.]|nr:diaminopimelate epimerase [Psychroflexus sp.]MDN6311095.1 diaminopimelate epimerase [Psychroflexus sp.]